MIDSLGYMEYDFSSLRKSKILDKEKAAEVFMLFFELKKRYKMNKIIDFQELCEFLNDDTYLIMNNEPRYKGKKVFFTGNAVEANKDDLINFISGPVDKYDLIVPLFIVPLNNHNQPNYMITTQEDPVFVILVKE